MFTRQFMSRVFSVLLVVLIMSGTASARPLSAPLGTAFTYQGKLTDGGAPANGTYDFEFKLYDALSGGNPVGGTVTQGDVTVTNGLFTVQLDFGNVFDGTALYLAIGVRPGASVGAYAALDPRQQLTAAPYAIYASNAPWSGLSGVPAGFADGVDNSTTYTAGSGLALNGVEFSVTGAPWSGLSGVPAGFADGVDDNTTYTAGDGLELVGTQFKGKGTPYQNVVIVAKSGGDFTSIQAALDSITTASTSNRYLVWVAPGVYSERVTMKPFVDIEGAGELTTKITFSGSATYTTATLLGANNAELRLLTVENTGGAAYAIAIYNSSAAPRLTHVTATASGGTSINHGVANSSSSPMMMNVTASASGGTDSRGVANNSSSPTMTNVTASAWGGTNGNLGVYNYASSPAMTNVTASGSGGTYSKGVYNETSSSPTMTNVTARASGGMESTGVYNYASSPTMMDVTASASGGTYNYGVYNNASSPTMTNVTASASGGTYNYGVVNDNSSPTIVNSVISGSGGSDNYGIYNIAASGAYTVPVNNSQIRGSTNTILNNAFFTTRVGASHLNGGAVAGGGTLTCAGVYDEAYTFYASTCP